MLDNCQTFKAAFLQRCAADGLTIPETHALVKQAIARLEATPEPKSASVWPWLKNNIPGLSVLSGGAEGLAKGIGERIPGLAAAAYVGVPVVAGGAAGYGLAKMEGLNDESPEEVQTQEKIEAYLRAAQRAKLQARLSGNRQLRRPSRPML